MVWLHCAGYKIGNALGNGFFQILYPLAHRLDGFAVLETWHKLSLLGVRQQHYLRHQHTACV